MSVIEEETRHLPYKIRTKRSVLSTLLNSLGSVKFGVILLILIVLVCLLGMLIRQHNVDGFDSYFAELGPLQRMLFSSLGFFDIYHSWYFIALLALLSLNIVIASIERFPISLRYITHPQIETSVKQLTRKPLNTSLNTEGTPSEATALIVGAYVDAGWRQVETTKKDGKIVVFAESGAWNRLGAYPVHVALLVILFSGVLSSHLSYSGKMGLAVGQTAGQISETVFRDGQPIARSRQLPFLVTCTDIEQKLINPGRSIESVNSLDWLTYLEFNDKGRTLSAVVQLNRPYVYRGYRFFHSTFLPIGKARSVLIEIKSETGPSEKVSLKRNDTFDLPDGSKVRFIDFRANLGVVRREENENSTRYQNPAATLEITSPAGAPKTVIAFRGNRKTDEVALNSFEGYTFRLLDFERVSEQHVLFVSYDPGSSVLYVGFSLLVLSLAAVFFFSHQRVWSLIEKCPDGTLRITLGGDTNRNHLSFKEKFNDVLSALKKDSGIAHRPE